jgi:hypothetical protein
MQRSRGKHSADCLVSRIAHTYQIGTELLTIFHCHKPPGLVVPEYSTHVACILLAMEGRSLLDTGFVGRRKPLEHFVALVNGDSAMQRIGPLLGNNIDDGRSGASQFC